MARISIALSTLAAALCAAALSVSQASAADLGGDCCADLEERIAELEATAARKGNRKVSLTISGWVNQQVMFWDDGGERNVYVHDLGTTLGSHFKFSGSANFAPGWDAGYVLHIEAMSSNGLTHSQERDRGFGSGSIQQSYWFLKSEALGKMSLGLQSPASDNAAIAVDGSGSSIPANWVAFDVASFGLRRADNGEFSNTLTNSLTWGGVGNCKGMGGVWGDCNGLPRKVARYDTPVLGGFSASASWGEDDLWDVAARYAGTWGDFNVALAAAYAETTDLVLDGTPFILGPDKLKYLQAGAYIENVTTGLFAYGAYGKLEIELPAGASFTSPDAETFYIKGGLRQRLTSLGATVLYGEFLHNSDSAGLRQTFSSPNFNLTQTLDTSSSLNVWGLGIVQEIDSAAMSLWIKYRQMSFDVDANFNGIPYTGLTEYQDFQYIGAGALINF